MARSTEGDELLGVGGVGAFVEVCGDDFGGIDEEGSGGGFTGEGAERHFSYSCLRAGL